MVDAVGSTAYTYDTNGPLAAEDGPWDSDIVSYAYDSHRQRTGLSLSQLAAGDWTQCQLDSVVTGSAVPVAGAIWGSPTSSIVNGSTGVWASKQPMRARIIPVNPEPQPRHSLTPVEFRFHGLPLSAPEGDALARTRSAQRRDGRGSKAEVPP